MFSLVITAFLTGLTAGGLSCFAVQGGLLTGSIAYQIDAADQAGETRASRRTGGEHRKSNLRSQPVPSPRMIQPIMLFMLAKLAAYTLLGALLGLLGSALMFSPAAKGFVQLAIGIFLVGNALRMFNVHPFFRFFNFVPPQRLTRYIRRVSKRGDAWITPLFLGALTVLIPCGVTQSVMAVAIGTADPMLGAMIMFAFVIGTSPTFIGVSWLATSLGSMFQKSFYRIVAVIVLLLGLYTLDGGLMLVGSPVSVSGLLQQYAQATEPLAVMESVALINVENNGYSPSRILLPANQPVEIRLVTNKTRSCSRAFYIPDLEIMEMLPETGEKVVTIPPQAPGTNMQFMCSMGMYGGVLQFQ